MTDIILPKQEEFIITDELDLLEMQQILNWEVQAIAIAKICLPIRRIIVSLIKNIRILNLNNGRLY